MHPAAMERAGYWFRDCSVPEPAPEPAETTSPEPAALTEAEKYAVIYPDRAARIRAAGGRPAKLDFGPPDRNWWTPSSTAPVRSCARSMRHAHQPWREISSR
jgi:hypothetical protein